jgi:polyisoprenoid-binding protein YceI
MTTLADLLGEPANAGVWTLVSERSRIAFSCRSLWGLVPVKGTFTDFSGDGQLANGSAFGRVDIRAASLVTGIGRRDAHLRSDDFFAVERFPTISVVVTAVEPNGSNTDGSNTDRQTGAALRSNLTIRGVTHPIPLTATVTALDGDTVEISARATIDRTQWDVSGNLLGMVQRPTTLTSTGVFVKSR